MCISAVGFGLSNLSIDIQKTARLLQSGLQYEPGKMYYFTSEQYYCRAPNFEMHNFRVFRGLASNLEN